MKENIVNLEAYGHEDLSFSYNERVVLPSDVESLSERIATLVETGRRLLAEETIEFGSAILRLARSKTSSLILQELDMSGVPGKFVNEVSNSLAMVRTQKFVLESIGQLENANFPSIRQFGVVCSNLTGETEFFLSRSETDAHDSGIFAGCLKVNHDHDLPSNLRRESLYALICEQPVLMPFLAIPVGFVVEFENNFVRCILNKEGTSVPIAKDTFLGQWIEKTRT